MVSALPLYDSATALRAKQKLLLIEAVLGALEVAQRPNLPKGHLGDLQQKDYSGTSLP